MIAPSYQVKVLNTFVTVACCSLIIWGGGANRPIKPLAKY